jgi:hypothetical protein
LKKQLEMYLNDSNAGSSLNKDIFSPTSQKSKGKDQDFDKWR